jgi:hypothetical protein
MSICLIPLQSALLIHAPSRNNHYQNSINVRYTGGMLTDEQRQPTQRLPVIGDQGKGWAAVRPSLFGVNRFWRELTLVTSYSFHHSTQMWLLLLIMSVAAFLRFWHIDRLPPGFYSAEAYEGLEAWHILTDSTYRPLFLPGNDGVPPLNAYTNAVTFGVFRLFGGEVGPVAMRVTAACLGVLGVLALYGLAVELRKLKLPEVGLSWRFPLFAAGTLAVMRWHFHFSRIGIEPIWTPLLWASATWLLLRGWRTGQWTSFMASGILAAAAMYAYKSAWMIPLLMIPMVGLLLFQSTDLAGRQNVALTLHSRLVSSGRQQWIGLTILAVVAFLLVVPLGWFFWQHPDQELWHTGQLATLDSSATEQASLWYSIRATFTSYVPFGRTGDLSVRHNLPGAPALNGWQAIAFYIGLVSAVWRLPHPSYAIALLGLVGMLLPGAFTTGAPHFHRILGATAPTALLCGIGLDQLWQWCRLTAVTRPLDRSARLALVNIGARSLRHVGWISVFLLSAGGVTATREYFVQWAALPGLYDKFEVGIWEVAQQIMKYPGVPVYMTPRSFGTRVLTLAMESTNHPAVITFDGRHIFPLTAAVSSDPELYVVLERDDFRTPLLLPGIFPTASLLHEGYDDRGQAITRLYMRPSGVEPQRPPYIVLKANVGDGIALTGYDVQPEQLRAGQILYLQLHWVVKEKPTADWTVFTHLLHKDVTGNHRWVAGHDSRPGAGSLPTTRWQAGWRILDEYQIPLPTDLPAGPYELAIGLYQPTGERLPTTGVGVQLGELTIQP